MSIDIDTSYEETFDLGGYLNDKCNLRSQNS